MRIGEVAQQAGTTAKAIRFYESEGLVPPPPRGSNGYRDYGRQDLQRIRMLVGLRSLDLPLEPAAELATLCAAGHCDEASADLRTLVADQRGELSRRIDELRHLDDRLATLERHLSVGDPPPDALQPERRLQMTQVCDCSCGQCCGCDCCGCGCPCGGHGR